MPLRHQTQTQGHGTPAAHIQLKPRRRGNPLAPVIKSIAKSAGNDVRDGEYTLTRASKLAPFACESETTNNDRSIPRGGTPRQRRTIDTQQKEHHRRTAPEHPAAVRSRRELPHRGENHLHLQTHSYGAESPHTLAYSTGNIAKQARDGAVAHSRICGCISVLILCCLQALLLHFLFLCEQATAEENSRRLLRKRNHQAQLCLQSSSYSLVQPDAIRGLCKLALQCYFRDV